MKLPYLFLYKKFFFCSEKKNLKQNVLNYVNYINVI